MNIVDREAFNKLVDETIQSELANPLADRHRTRWARINEIDAILKSIVALNPPSRRKPQKSEISYHETAEWKALVYEGTLLEAIERTNALELDWPIWQAGQHFHYLETDGSIREGEVITFDTDAETIECSTWPLHDFHGYVNSEGSRKLQVITRTQIEDAERREQEHELALKKEAALAQLSKEQERLPLFATQLSLT